MPIAGLRYQDNWQRTPDGWRISHAPGLHRLAGLVGSPPADLRRWGPPVGRVPTVSPAPAGRARDVAALALALVALVALFFGNLAFWARDDLYDTAKVQAKAEKLVGSTDTQQAVTALLVERVVKPAVAQADASVPSILSPLTDRLDRASVDLATKAIDQAVAAETTQEIATRLVGAVNDQLVAGTGPITLTPGQIVAIAAPSLADNRVVAKVVDVADESGCCVVELAQRDQLPFVWQHVDAIRAAGVVLPIVAVVAAGGAVALARRRGRVVLVLGIGTVVVGLATLGPLWAGSHWGVDRIGGTADPSTTVVRQAARTAFLVTDEALRRQSWVLVVVGSVATAAVIAVRVVKRRSPSEGSPKVPA